MPRFRRGVSVLRLTTAFFIITLTCPVPAMSAGASDAPVAAADQGSDVTPEEAYGLWTLLPAVTAIVLGIISRQVILALAAGIYVAALMGLPWTHPVGPDEWVYNPLTGMKAAVDTYLVGAVSNPDHVRIMIFTLIIGGMVGILAANGGTAALVNLVVPWARNRRRCQVVGWAAGLLVFFDDYANAMIVGPTMRPITDRLRISREKLAYIVDSTAAPVASVALIGTWLGAEVGFLQDGFGDWTEVTRPAFLEGVTGFGAFYASIPYRFYPFFALALVFLVAWTGRDFGSMLRAERRAAIEGHPDSRDSRAVEGPPHPSAGAWWYATVPIGLLIVVTMVILFVTGRAGLGAQYDSRLEWLRDLLKGADPYGSIMYGAISAAAGAILITQVTRSLKLQQTVDAFLSGMSRMFPAVVVLVLAWGLSDGTQALHLGKVATGVLQESRFSPHLLPLAVFVASCLVSFSTGTSWGTMGILCPVTVQIAGGLGAELPAGEALHVFYGSVGSVLAGAIFGDHCSPISDTTVLSSLASECELGAHVWTQLPYALLAAVLEIVVGDLMCNYTGLPPYLGLVFGVLLLYVFLRVFGGRVDAGPAIS